jgi:hypothetical protein
MMPAANDGFGPYFREIHRLSGELNHALAGHFLGKQRTQCVEVQPILSGNPPIHRNLI